MVTGGADPGRFGTVAVVGAGAIGTALAIGLARAGHRVRLVARGARLDWLRAHPAELDSGGALIRQQLDVVGSAAPWTSDCVLLCTKANALAEALALVSPRLRPGGLAVTLQNGVEAPDQAAATLPGAAIVAGRIHGFFERDGQRVRHVGVPPGVVIGGTNPAGRVAAPGAVALFAAAGFACEVAPDIASDLWEKLALFASLSLVALALNVPAGQVCDTPDGETLLRTVMAEVVVVARARGTVLDPGVVERLIAFVRVFPAAATTSLQRDHATGQPSEYAAVIGALLRRARAAGCAVPTIARLDAAVRAAATAPG